MTQLVHQLKERSTVDGRSTVVATCGASMVVSARSANPPRFTPWHAEVTCPDCLGATGGHP